MELAQRNLNINYVATANLGIGVGFDDDSTALCIGSIEIQVSINEGFATQHFNYANNCLGRCPRTVVVIVLIVNANIIGTNTEYDFVFAIHVLNGNFIGLDVLHINVGSAIQREANVIAVFNNSTVKEVHLRCTDKACNKHVIGILIQIDRCINLLNVSVLHNNDTGAHGHCLYLVVRNVNKGCAKFFVQARNFCSHCRTQLCIEVRKRLVQKEHLGVTNNSTSKCNSLTLTTGERLRLSFKIFCNAENFCGFHYLFVNLIIGHMNGAQRECHVLINTHMGIKSIVLENHCNVSILRLKIVNDFVINAKFACGNFLQARNHAQRSGFSASGRTDKYDKFLIVNIHTEVVYCLYASVIYFENMFE